MTNAFTMGTLFAGSGRHYDAGNAADATQAANAANAVNATPPTPTRPPPPVSPLPPLPPPQTPPSPPSPPYNATNQDMLAQTAIEKRAWCRVDRRRLRNAAVVGSIYSGMCVPQVYKVVESIGSAMVTGAPQGKRATVLKAVMNTGALCFFGNVSNMAGRLVLEGRSLTDALDQILPKMPEIIKFVGCHLFIYNETIPATHYSPPHHPPPTTHHPPSTTSGTT